MGAQATVGPRLMRALADTEVLPGALEARVGDRRIEGSSVDEVRHKLATALYERIHAGRPDQEGTGPRSLRDAATEALLAGATPHATTRVRSRRLASEDGTAVVELDGVRVRVPEGQVVDVPVPRADATCPADARAGDTGGDGAVGREVLVELASVRAALSPGFFLVDGSLGRPTGRPLLRVYLHIAAVDHAPAVWRAVLTRLEAAEVPYRAKISSSPLLFPRRDALVVYLPPGSWHAVDEVIAAGTGTGLLGAETSPFTHELAPGIGVAWEPEDDRPGRRGMSFGEHRTMAVATGLVGHALPEASGSREEAVAAALTEAGVDPLRPGRGLRSPEFHRREVA
ncbi:hypothetical protein EF908_24150 [Streptomyces sp. WAC04770]|nr:T3SS effector HopA1 family protein [Streptomyces sp. WAC04770]RST21055.1 hypothetical protein EF908_24150 [Streptomyces sp. WAC04770]